MTDESMFGDQVYNDREYNDDPEDNPQLDTPDTLLDDDLRADPLDTGYSPPDYEPAATRFGTTADEQRDGASLDQRLAQEQPDISVDDDPLGDPDADDGVPDVRAGRLIAPDEGSHGDVESDEIAFDAGIDGGGASAEEAAVHIIGEDDIDGV